MDFNGIKKQLVFIKEILYKPPLMKMDIKCKGVARGIFLNYLMMKTV